MLFTISFHVECTAMSLTIHNTDTASPVLLKESVHNLVENEICICLDLSSKYTSHITVYDRSAEKRPNTYFYLTDSFIRQLEKNIRDLFLCVFGMNDITMQSNGLYPIECACHKADPGVAHIISEGRVDFEIRCLETNNNKHFNSFNFVISSSQMRLLLYKNGQYAFKGLSLHKPLSFFGIDQETLLRVAHSMISLCNPGQKLLFQNKIYKHNSQVNKSGCVYFVENYFIERKQRGFS